MTASLDWLRLHWPALVLFAVAALFVLWAEQHARRRNFLPPKERLPGGWRGGQVLDEQIRRERAQRTERG